MSSKNIIVLFYSKFFLFSPLKDSTKLKTYLGNSFILST